MIPRSSHFFIAFAARLIRAAFAFRSLVMSAPSVLHYRVVSLAGWCRLDGFVSFCYLTLLLLLRRSWSVLACRGTVKAWIQNVLIWAYINLLHSYITTFLYYIVFHACNQVSRRSEDQPFASIIVRRLLDCPQLLNGQGWEFVLKNIENTVVFLIIMVEWGVRIVHVLSDTGLYGVDHSQ